MKKKIVLRLLIIYMIFDVINLADNVYLLNRSILFYSLGILSIVFNNINLRKYIRFIYIFCVFLLLYLLIFGNPINGSKAWITVYNISIQPSEFMKIILIIYLSILSNAQKYIFKCFIITLIPSILTFLEPDTGNVIFYLLIFISIIFYKEKNKIHTNKIIFLLLTFSILLMLIYIFFKNYLIEIFGYSIYYRLNRIMSLFDGNSYQLNKAYISLSNASLFGSSSSYYIPYEYTDFAFAHMSSKIGLLGTIIYLLFNMYFNYYLINSIKYMPFSKCIMLFTFVIMKLFQELVHIFMNIGLFPITGITLPFISYGGSSILSYFIILSYFSNDRGNHYMDMDFDSLDK